MKQEMQMKNHILKKDIHHHEDPRIGSKQDFTSI